MRYSEIGFAGRLLLEKVDELCRLDSRGVFVQNLDSWKLVREFINSVQRYGIGPLACVAKPDEDKPAGAKPDESKPVDSGLLTLPSGFIIIRDELPAGLSFWRRLKFLFRGR